MQDSQLTVRLGAAMMLPTFWNVTDTATLDSSQSRPALVVPGFSLLSGARLARVYSDIAKLFNGEMSRRAPERAPKDPFKFGARELKRVWHIACMSTLTRMRSE